MVEIKKVIFPLIFRVTTYIVNPHKEIEVRKMSKLVSIIIPCFNAEKWIGEAIDSCLQQTYPNIEIIVIDDGSTDNSLEIIRSYGNRVICKSLPHQGGNRARNEGFSLSNGEYIQFLDADDYILPEKIAMQVSLLESTGIDVVYGDWRHQHHFADDRVVLDKIEISGTQSDILESLLANWWVAPAAIFYTRKAVENSGGWDESLEAAQDKDFFLSVVINGATVAYQPGCYSIYRRYGKVTVSTASKPRWLKNHDLVLQKMQRILSQQNRLSSQYRFALAKSYFDLARESLPIDYKEYKNFIQKALAIFPAFQTNSKRPIYNFVQYCLGFRQTEGMVSILLVCKNYLNYLSNKILHKDRKVDLSLL